jgi:hypothetical protein
MAGHVAHIGEIKNSNKSLGGKLKETDHLEDLGIDGRIIPE